MTEKEKMINGELYNANYDEVLIKERILAKDLCYEYNNLKPSLVPEREEILRRILGKCGNKLLIEQPFFCDYGYNIEVGDNFYANHNLVILDPASVIIGDNVHIGPNCGIYTASHPVEYEIRNKGFEYAEAITIGNNVWIGGNVTILPGVVIGDNVVIGAGSVVNKDIPSDCIAVGNPCKAIKSLPKNGTREGII